MRLQRALTLHLTEDQAETIDALGFVYNVRWTVHLRLAIGQWLDEQARDPKVIEAKRARRRYRAHEQRAALHLVKGGAS